MVKVTRLSTLFLSINTVCVAKHSIDQSIPVCSSKRWTNTWKKLPVVLQREVSSIHMSQSRFSLNCERTVRKNGRRNSAVRGYPPNTGVFSKKKK